jgi:hypothetical protein
MFTLEESREECKSLKSDIDFLKSEIKFLKSDIKSLVTSKKELVEKINNLIKLKKDSLLPHLSLSEITYKDLFTSLYSSLTNELICPLTFDKFTHPVVLPSGRTIEKAFMKVLISQRKRDPFDRRKKCIKMVPNILVKNMLEVLGEVARIAELKEMPERVCWRKEKEKEEELSFENRLVELVAEEEWSPRSEGPSGID